MLASMMYRAPSFRSDEGAVYLLYKRMDAGCNAAALLCKDWVVRTASPFENQGLRVGTDYFLRGEAPFWDFDAGVFFLIRLSIWASVVSFMARTPSVRTRFKRLAMVGSSRMSQSSSVAT